MHHCASLGACLCVGEHADQATSYSPVHVASSETTRTLSTTPAAQAARAFASPEPSPAYSPHPQPASADNSSVGLRVTELAASPVSPQAATEAAVRAMRSEPILSGGTHAREAQTDGSNLPPLPSVSKNRYFDSVPVVLESPAVVESSTRGVDSVPAPISIPIASVTVSQAITQEPLYPPLTKAEPTADNRSMPAVSRSIQQTDLPVTMPPQAPATLRPVGAFSYTAPAAATGVPPSSDRYIPAIGFSPSRARVARNPPAGPLLGHARKQSYTMDPLPAVPQQTILSTSDDAPAGYKQETFPVPAVSTSTMPAAPMDLSRTEVQSTGAVYGSGVTSTALATGTALGSHPALSSTTAPMQVLTETAPSVAAYTTGPPVLSSAPLENATWYPGSPVRQLHATPADTAQLPMPTQAAGISFGPPPVLGTGQEAAPFSLPVASAGPGVIPTGPKMAPTALSQGVYVPPTPAKTASSAASGASSVASASAESGTVFAAPDAANLVLTPGGSTPGGLVLGELASGSQGIAPGPLQAGQTWAPGPVAEGTEDVLQASDSNAWSDADSITAEALSETWHGRCTQPGPVCEGIETNSDVWSDSASSDPGTPLSGSQATVGVSYHSYLFYYSPVLGLLPVVLH